MDCKWAGDSRRKKKHSEGESVRSYKSLSATKAVFPQGQTHLEPQSRKRLPAPLLAMTDSWWWNHQPRASEPAPVMDTHLQGSPTQTPLHYNDHRSNRRAGKDHLTPPTVHIQPQKYKFNNADVMEMFEYLLDMILFLILKSVKKIARSII